MCSLNMLQQIVYQQLLLTHIDTIHLKMTSIETVYKNGMYRSQCAPIIYPSSNTNQLNGTRLQDLRHSVISAENKAGDQKHKQNNISYKYERVDNIFRLVQVNNSSNLNNKNNYNQVQHFNHSNKSNRSHQSDPREQQIFDDNVQAMDKINKLSTSIQELTNRIISLEFQQAKTLSLQKKFNQVTVTIKTLETQGNYLSEKITGMHYQIKDVKERLEEIQEQGSSYEKQFSQIFRLMKQIKQEAIKNDPYASQSLQKITEKIKQQVMCQIQKIENKLTAFSSSSHSLQQQMIAKLSYSNRLSLFSTFRTDNPQQSYKFKYRQSFQTKDNKVYSFNQMTYHIDKEGRLMDASGFVLLDHNNREIKIKEEHLIKLKQFGLLQ